MPAETEFSDRSELAQEDVERRDKISRHKQTVYMWKNTLKHLWKPTQETQKLIDRIPKMMEIIIEIKGALGREVKINVK